jgi:hypothetical protein
MSHDVAHEAEAASPLTGGKIWEITALPMCNGQRSVKSLQKMTPSMTSQVSSKVYKVISQTNKPRDYDCLQKNPLIAPGLLLSEA